MRPLPSWWYSLNAVLPPWLHVLYAAKTSSDRLTSLLALERVRGRDRVGVGVGVRVRVRVRIRVRVRVSGLLARLGDTAARKEVQLVEQVGVAVVHAHVERRCEDALEEGAEVALLHGHGGACG